MGCKHGTEGFCSTCYADNVETSLREELAAMRLLVREIAFEGLDKENRLIPSEKLREKLIQAKLALA